MTASNNGAAKIVQIEEHLEVIWDQLDTRSSILFDQQEHTEERVQNLEQCIKLLSEHLKLTLREVHALHTALARAGVISDAANN